MIEKIKHGIIGCGRIAPNHINACKDNNLDVCICCDLDLEKAKALATRYGIEYYTNNYFEIIDDHQIDSISICTDHYSHTQIAKSGAYKKHIVIEKPLSHSYFEAEKFARFIQDSTKIISVISQHRFDDVVELIKSLLEKKAFGKVTLVNIKLKCSKEPSYYSDNFWRGSLKYEGGSTVINQSFHLLDILTYFFGMPKEVKSYLNNFKFYEIIETEDTCIAILQYDEFLCCFSSTNTSVTEWSTLFEIIGTEGEVSFTLDFPEKLVALSLSQQFYDDFKRRINLIEENYKSNINSYGGYFGLSHIRQFSNFVNAILGLESIKITVSDILKTQKLIAMIYSNQ